MSLHKSFIYASGFLRGLPIPSFSGSVTARIAVWERGGGFDPHKIKSIESFHVATLVTTLAVTLTLGLGIT